MDLRPRLLRVLVLPLVALALTSCTSGGDGGRADPEEASPHPAGK